MRRAERIALAVALAAAAFQFVAGRFVPEYYGELDRDFPRMTPGQSAWLLGVPALIVVALVLIRRWVEDARLRMSMTVVVAALAVAAVAVYLLMPHGPA